MPPQKDTSASNDSVLSEFQELLKDLQAKSKTLGDHLAPIQQKVQEKEQETSKGVSFLEVKYQTLLEYVLHLAFFVHLKLSGKQVQGHPVVDTLVQLRVILEKMKPIEGKLKYQIDKLVRAAVMETRSADASKTAEGTSADAAESNPLAFKPNPMNLLGRDGEESDDMDDTTGEDGIYRPPKLAPVSYNESNKGKKAKEDRDLLRLKEKSSRSRMMKDLLAEMAETPEEIDALGGVNEGTGFGDRLDNVLAEKRQYEEDNYVRLAVTRKEKKRSQAKNRMMFSNEFDNLDDFNNLVGMGEVEKEEKERHQNILKRKRLRTK